MFCARTNNFCFGLSILKKNRIVHNRHTVLVVFSVLFARLSALVANDRGVQDSTPHSVTHLFFLSTNLHPLLLGEETQRTASVSLRPRGS
jgi:hypothetical protein